MKILFIFKGSTEIGLGHVIRSTTLARNVIKTNPSYDVKLALLGDGSLKKIFFDIDYESYLLKDDLSCPPQDSWDVVFIDMIDISLEMFSFLRKNSRLIVSLSPVFNRMNDVDILFTRTSYHGIDESASKVKIYAGLEYSIISDACLKIGAGTYEEILGKPTLSVAVSMGGGDAANKTLGILQEIKKCRVPTTFWVMLGEGYQFSYDHLVGEIARDTHHEIILARTNRSMWQILKNCALVILPGGITTYEAAYAGLPSVNLFSNFDQVYLVKELEEKGVCLSLGVLSEPYNGKINNTIESLYHNKKNLMQMHINSKDLIDGKASERILEKCRIYI